MNLSKLSKYVLLLVIVLNSSTLFTQESDNEPDEAFAAFLYRSALYDFAAEEYERLLFSHPNDLKYLKKLIDCYKKTNQRSLIEDRLSLIKLTDPDLQHEYFDLLLIEGKTQTLRQQLSGQDMLLPQKDVDLFTFKSHLLDMDWEEADRIYTSNSYPAYSTLMQNVSTRKFKSPAMAGIMSGIIPGLGRVYAKDYIDGLISAVFIAASSVQSYRRFKAQGINSAGGWIYGGVALGFYVSNIYGSVQSAKYYNQKKNEELRKEAYRILSADF